MEEQARSARTLIPLQPFEQRFSEERKRKNRMMKALHLRTGKAYRKHLKKVRRENREGQVA